MKNTMPEIITCPTTSAISNIYSFVPTATLNTTHSCKRCWKCQPSARRNYIL